MKEFSSKKRNSVFTDSLEISSSTTSKKNWQSPRLHEIDYSVTSAGGSVFIDDGGSWSS